MAVAGLPRLFWFFIFVSCACSQQLDSPYPSRSTILAKADQARENATIVNHVRLHTNDHTVLGYVTPWNPKGTKLSERFRGKFDIIAPAWHTVDVVHTSGQVFYVIEGGSTGPEDDEWMRRMQEATTDGNGRELPPVKITPRYVLDRFTPEDLVELLSSEEYMTSVADSVFNSVMDHDYDGAVFECAAVWAIEPLVEKLAARLHNHSKLLSVVIPAMRSESDQATEQTNKIGLHAMKTLSPYADHVMVMTYDHAGLAGRSYKNIYGLDDLPKGSPLAQDGVRSPGPNAPLDFLTLNIETLSGTLESGGQFDMNEIDLANPFYNQNEKTNKLLVGLPLYGYRYPIGWFDKNSLKSEGITRLPPKSPMVSQDNDSEAQEEFRAKADKRESDSPHIVPVLRFPGEPFKHEDLIDQLKQSKALVRLDASSQEQYIDYMAKLPQAHQPKTNETDSTQIPLRPLASYYRAYFPSSHTMRQRLSTVSQFSGVGIALWDVGQAAEWLLHEL